jgi:hypothetical protein
MSIAFTRRTAAVVAAIVLVASCGPTARSTGPISPTASAVAPAGVLGRDWQRVEAVDAPPGSSATVRPYENPDGLGHPMHYQGGQADIVDVVAYGEGFVAGGFLETAAGPRAAAWASTDGVRWALVEGFPATDGTVVRAVAARPDGLVAVGAEGAHPAAWHSSDGRAWQRSSSAALSDTPGELMTVLATQTTFIAAGRAGLGTEARAAFWSSTDGVEWALERDPVDAAATRVEGLAAGAGRLVAVGVTLDGSAVSGGAAWTSADARTWGRVASPEPAFGPIHGVAAARDGFIAVGTDVAGTKAIVWTSPDGLGWKAAPDADALDNHGLQIEMRDIAAVGQGYVAVGHLLFGTQYPSGVIWSSPNGTTWTRAPDSPVLQQAKLFGVAANDHQAAVVGTFGSPDFAIPTVWVSPPRG